MADKFDERITVCNFAGEKTESPISPLKLLAFIIVLVGLACVLTFIVTKRAYEPGRPAELVSGQPWARSAWSTDADTIHVLIWTGGESMLTQTFTLYHPGKGIGAPPDSVKYETEGQAVILTIGRITKP